MSVIIAGTFIGLGVALLALAGIGLHKYEDFFYKIHIVSKGPSLGVMLVLVGVAFYFGTFVTTVKCMAIGLFVFITVPVSSSLLALARYEILYGELQDESDPED